MAMQPIIVSIGLFSLFWLVASVAFLVMAGAFPLATRPDLAGSGAKRLLVRGNGLLVLLLIAATAWFGISRLHWTSLVLCGGLIILFAPALFHAWPARWRDGLAGQVVVSAAVGAAMVLLAVVAAP